MKLSAWVVVGEKKLKKNKKKSAFGYASPACRQWWVWETCPRELPAGGMLISGEARAPACLGAVGTGRIKSPPRHVEGLIPAPPLALSIPVPILEAWQAPFARRSPLRQWEPLPLCSSAADVIVSDSALFRLAGALYSLLFGD